ncbi:hypothetical protein C8R42DRAFT_661047 [Lentinula raphanica]|nr:hypothetical protein C8R42DRAFT_661047 [Lentinula raphanica]
MSGLSPHPPNDSMNLPPQRPIQRSLFTPETDHERRSMTDVFHLNDNRDTASFLKVLEDVALEYRRTTTDSNLYLPPPHPPYDWEEPSPPSNSSESFLTQGRSLFASKEELGDPTTEFFCPPLNSPLEESIPAMLHRITNYKYMPPPKSNNVKRPGDVSGSSSRDSFNSPAAFCVCQSSRGLAMASPVKPPVSMMENLVKFFQSMILGKDSSEANQCSGDEARALGREPNIGQCSCGHASYTTNPNSGVGGTPSPEDHQYGEPHRDELHNPFLLPDIDRHSENVRQSYLFYQYAGSRARALKQQLWQTSDCDNGCIDDEVLSQISGQFGSQRYFSESSANLMDRNELVMAWRNSVLSICRPAIE